MHAEISEDTLTAKLENFKESNNLGSSHENHIPWRCGDPYRYPITKKGDPWENCFKLIQNHDKGMCDAWKEEVDKLLVFAGLFSAAVTAFTVESYQWLQEDPRDMSIRSLTQITLQLSRDIYNITVPQATQALTQEPPPISASAIRINIFWFLSLTLSLGTAVIGISCMQWLREYQRDAALPHQDALALRQMRLDGLIKWHVPGFLSSLPILLQSAVVLFFAGLLDLLWTLNKMVAIFFTVVVSLIVLFLIVTTTAPFFQHIFLGERHVAVSQCAYKSPQSWAFYRFGINALGLLTQNVHPMSKFQRVAPLLLKLKRSLHDHSWIEYDIRQWRRLRDVGDVVDALVWIDETFTQSVDVVHSIHHCLLSLQNSTAARIVSRLDPNAADHIHEVLRDKALNGPSYAKQIQEIIAVSFLERHKRTHHSLTINYLEAIIRLLNTQDFRPFIEWPVSSPSGLPDDIVDQFLMCVKLLIARERVTAPQVITIWSLIQRTLQSPTAIETSPGASRARLGFAIIGEFERWLTRCSETMEKRDRVALCVYGMISTFKPFENPLFSWTDYPEGVSLVQALDGYLAQLGGGAVFLSDSVNQQWCALTGALNSPPSELCPD